MTTDTLTEDEQKEEAEYKVKCAAFTAKVVAEVEAAQKEGRLPKPPLAKTIEEHAEWGGVVAEIGMAQTLAKNSRVCAMLDTMALLCGGRLIAYSDEGWFQRDYVFVNNEMEAKFSELAQKLLWEYEGCSFG